MWDTIRGLVAGGSTILLTTQYLEEADQLADRLVVIDHGKIVAQGTPDALKSSVGTSTLHLDLADAADGAAAQEVLHRVLGRRPMAEGTKRFSLPLPDADQGIDALSALRAAGISVASLQVSKPSLDEVFLTLTGRPTETSSDTTDLQETLR